MQECETSTDKGSFVKRVSVRSGGAGHAHSGVIKGRVSLNENGSASRASSGDRVTSPGPANTKIVKLGR
jgi:hypothetical protein